VHDSRGIEIVILNVVVLGSRSWYKPVLGGLGLGLAKIVFLTALPARLSLRHLMAQFYLLVHFTVSPIQTQQ